MKKLVFGLLAAVAVGVLAWREASVDAQGPPAQAGSSQPQTMRPRIGLVNIAQVLKGFNKVAVESDVVKEKRQFYADHIKKLREQIAECQKRAQSPNPAERDKAIAESKELQRKAEDLDTEGQKVVGEMMEKSLLEIYQNIKSSIEAVAVTNNIELVMGYPDAPTPQEENQPQWAARKLQSPGLIPYYQRGMDITAVVLQTLNSRHPVNKTAATPATGPNGVQPTGFQSGGNPPKH